MSTTKETEELYKALEEIRTRFGIETIHSPIRMKALLSDLVPTAKKETKLFFYVINNKEMINQIQNNKEISFEYVKKRMQEDEGLSDEWTDIMTQAIFRFFQYEVKKKTFEKKHPIKNIYTEQKKAYKHSNDIELVWREYLPKIQKKVFFPKIFFTPNIPWDIYTALEKKCMTINRAEPLENPIGILANKRFGIISGFIVTYREISIWVGGKYGKLRVKYDEIQDIKVTRKGNVSRLKILKKNGEIILFAPDSGVYEWFEFSNFEKALKMIVGI